MEKAIRLNTRLLTTLSHVIGMTDTVIMEVTNIKSTTFYTIKRTPLEVTVQQLLQFANVLHIPVSRFFTADDYDLIERREYYIAEPYEPCYYDSDKVQQIILSRTVATWQDAANITGMARNRIRGSLLSQTRLPVTRFLTICNAFGIDPFTILIDPNQPARGKAPRRRKETATSASSGPPTDAKRIQSIPASDLTALRREVTRIRADLAQARREIAELSKQYSTLLKAHNALSHRVQVNIENFTDSHLSIAAESDNTDKG